jgi:1,4-dihydroxy-2-naphthoate polyprenyltransferase
MHRMIAFGGYSLAFRANFGRQIPEKRLTRVILRYGTPVNLAAGGMTCVRPGSWAGCRREAPIRIERTAIMNPSMWAKALRIIPRLDKDEWDQLDLISKWLIATRAAVLIMTFISAAIAGIFAFADGQFNYGLWLLVTIGLVMAHATNNLLNDLTDYRKGVDKDNYFRTQYGAQPIQQGLWTAKQLLTYAAVTGLIALACGIALTFMRGPAVLALLAAGAFFVLFYTWPLKYIGLGEIAVIVVWGPLMIGGGYYVITGQWSWLVVLASLPYALGPTTVIFGKHIDKHDPDKAKGIHTLPVIIGEKAARYVALTMMALMYILVVYLVITGFFTPVMLIVLLALTLMPSVWRMYSKPYPRERPADFPAEAWPTYFAAAAFMHNRRYGLLFIAGLLVDAILHVLKVV